MRNRLYGDVTLIDGTVVDSGSESWRLECEARAVLAMPTLAARRNYLSGYRDLYTGRYVPGIADRRGDAACAELKAKILQIHQAGVRRD